MKKFFKFLGGLFIPHGFITEHNGKKDGLSHSQKQYVKENMLVDEFMRKSIKDLSVEVRRLSGKD